MSSRFFVLLLIVCAGCDQRPTPVDDLRISLHGRAFLETPIHGADVEVLSFVDGVEGDVLASGMVTDGAFELEMEATNTGPFLVRVFGLAAEYDNVATGQVTRFGFSDELLSLFVLDEVADKTFDKFAVNGLTTIAADFAQTLVNSSTNLTEAIHLSDALVAEHLVRPSPFDLIRTNGSNLDGDVAGDLEAEHRIALFHAGLARHGAETALTLGLAPSALPSIAMIGLLRRDLGNGKLDGFGVTGERVWHTSLAIEPLDSNTIRWRLASAIERWLNNVPLVEGDDTRRNTTELVASPYSVRNGFFDLLSSNGSILFGSEPGQLFDRVGPIIDVQSPTNESAIGGIMTILVAAEDVSGVKNIRVDSGMSLIEALGADEFPSISGLYQARLDTHMLPDGEMSLAIVAEDTLGNETISNLHLVVSNTGAVVEVDTPAMVNASSVAISVEVTESVAAVVELTVTVNGLEVKRMAYDGGPIDFDVAVPCETRSEVVVRVEDAAGVASTAQRFVGCDSEPPSVALAQTYYVAEDRLAISYSADGSSILYAGLEDENNTLIDWLSAPAFKKFFHRLDYLPNVGRSESLREANLPTLKFAAADEPGEVSTDPSALAVEYRYLSDGAALRDWELLDYPGAGAHYLIPVSYQSLDVSMAGSAPEAEHRIEVRVTDAAGNRTLREFDFTIAILTPPFRFGGCDITSELSDFTMRNRNLPQLYAAVGSVPVVRGDLQYALDLPPGSTLEGDRVEISLAGSEVWSAVQSTRFFQTDYEFTTTGWSSGPYPSSCTGTAPPYYTYERTSGTSPWWPFGSCMPGQFPTGAVAWDDSGYFMPKPGFGTPVVPNPPSYKNVHTTQLSVLDKGVYSTLVPDEVVDVVFGEDRAIEVSMVSPRFRTYEKSPLLSWTEADESPSHVPFYDLGALSYRRYFQLSSGSSASRFTVSQYVAGVRVHAKVPTIDAHYSRLANSVVPVVYEGCGEHDHLTTTQ